MSNSHLCPICCKPGGGTNNHHGFNNENETPLNRNNSERVKLQKRFCKLFQRYLAISEVAQSGNDGETKIQLQFVLQEITEFGIVTCECCLKVMESFCDIYTEIKNMELILSWKVWTLKNIMEGAKDEPSVAYLKGYVKKLEGNETCTNEIIQTFNLVTTSIIEKCSQKVAHSFPKLAISRLNSDEVKSSQAVSKTSLLRKCKNGTKRSAEKSSKTLPPSGATDQHEGITKTVDRNRIVDGSSLENYPSDTNILPGTSSCNIANQDYYELPDSLEVSDEEADLGRKAGTPSTNVEDYCSAETNRLPPQNDTELVPPPVIPVTKNNSQDISRSSPISESKFAIVVEMENVPKFEVDLEAANDEVGDIDMESEHTFPINSEENESPVGTTPPSNMTEAIGKRLRVRQACSNCNMAFTSSEKLLAHEKNHESSVIYDQPSLACSSPKLEGVSDDDGDTMSWTSSSSDGGDDDDGDDDYSFISDLADNEPEQPQEIQDLKPTINPPVSKSKTNKIPNKSSTKIPSSSNLNSTRVNSKLAKLKYKSTKQKSKLAESQSQQMGLETRGLYKHIHFKCPDCSSLHPDMRSILIHRRESKSCSSGYDPKTNIKVEILAPKNMKTKFDLKGFAIIDLPQEIVTCKICSLDLFSADDLTEHEKLHGTFNCNFCQADFSSATALALHELTHDKDYQTTNLKQCPRCDLKFNMELYIRHHLKSHLDINLNEPICAICKTTTISAKRKGSFPGHLKRYHDLSSVTDLKEIYRCTECDCKAYFLAVEQLREHLLHRHNINAARRSAIKALHCKDCDKRYHIRAELREHRLKNHVKSDEVIPCSIEDCTKVFEKRKELEWHLKSHEFTSTKSLCVKCGKVIPLVGMASHLKKHERMDKIESGELKPPDKLSFVCEKCGKKFRKRADLNFHSLSHTGPDSWRFSCDICSKKCMTKGKLEEHMRTHSQDKPFACQICGVKYAHRHNLRIHVNSKHADKVQDIARKVVRVNVPTSKKGVKRKRVAEKSVETTDTDDDDSE